MSNLNGHYNTHDVIISDNMHGERIKGKLSEFKTPQTAHLWKNDDTLPAMEKHEEIIFDLIVPEYYSSKQTVQYIANIAKVSIPAARNRMYGYLNRGVIHNYGGKYGIKIKVKELKALKFAQSGYLIDVTRTPRYNAKLEAVSSFLKIPMKTLKFAVEKGLLKKREFKGKQVYYYSDVMDYIRGVVK